MRIRSFELASAARERAGLLTTVNGGFNVIADRHYPTTLDLEISLAVEVDVDGDEYDLDLAVALSDEDGMPVDVGEFRREGKINLSTPARYPMTLVVPFPINSAGMSIPRPGTYRFTLFDHGREVSFIRFYADLVEEELRPD